MKSKYTVKDFTTDLFFDIVGSFIYAIAINCFARPAHFATGGVGGLAIIINYVTKAPVGATQMILNVPLIILSYKILGRFFILRTAKTMVIMSFMLDFFDNILPLYTGDPMLAAIFTGLFDGLGIVMIYLRGGSTGGTDFLTMSIRKKMPHISLGSISMCINGIVLIIGAFAFGNIDAVLYGAIAAFTGSMVIDKIMYGVGAGKMVFIITDDAPRVAKAIDDTTGRGSSIVDIYGSYTMDKKQMVISAMSKNQVFAARKNAHEADPGCFMMIGSTDEVFGNGFTEHHD